jgi:hypothetical protein
VMSATTAPRTTTIATTTRSLPTTKAQRSSPLL